MIKKLLSMVVGIAVLLTPFAFSVSVQAAGWDVTGDYVFDIEYLGSTYTHDVSLVQDESGDLTGNGGSPAGANVYTWEITSGTVTGTAIDFMADYTATADAVTPPTTMHVVGVIAEDGSMSGTWSDNYNGGERAGTWETSSGEAVFAEDGNVTTNPATNITAGDATLNGTNGDNAAIGHSFWASLSTFSTASPTLPSGVYSTPDMGAIAANTPFSAQLSSVSGLPAITDDTTYYFAAWSNVDGTWYPGEVLQFTTGDGTDGTIGGNVEGEGELAVDSIEVVDNTATANGTFASGWEYVFHITVPTDETDLAMKFSNWAKTGGGGTIPAANNIRISSSQADNGGATVLITAENVYSTPDLHMVTDLDSGTDGIQVEVTVEVAVPVGTPSGAYTTSYGVQTN